MYVEPLTISRTVSLEPRRPQQPGTHPWTLPKKTQNVLLPQIIASRIPSISQCNLSCLPQGRSVSATTTSNVFCLPIIWSPDTMPAPTIPASPTPPQITQTDNAALKSLNTPSLEDSSPPSDRQTGRPPPCSSRRRPRSCASRCRSKSPRHRQCRSRCPP